MDQLYRCSCMAASIAGAVVAEMMRWTVSINRLVWEEAILRDRNFAENFRYGILLEPQGLRPGAADLLLPPGMATKGAQLDLSLATRWQRFSIARVHADSEFFQGILFEPLGVSPA